MKDIVLHSIAGMARSIFMKAAQGSSAQKYSFPPSNPLFFLFAFFNIYLYVYFNFLTDVTVGEC